MSYLSTVHAHSQIQQQQQQQQLLSVSLYNWLIASILHNINISRWSFYINKIQRNTHSNITQIIRPIYIACLGNKLVALFIL